MTDAAREAFERWMSEDWKWPDAVARRYGHYVLAHTDSAWKAWQAALSEQPAIDMDELRRAVCLIGTVGTIDGHDVIRRNSALEIIDARIDRANS